MPDTNNPTPTTHKSASALPSGKGQVEEAFQGKAPTELTNEERATAAMTSRRERYAGSAVGVGSIGFGETGVYTSADGVIGEDELLLDGQEEVFSRTEVESGRIEHHAGEDHRSQTKPGKDGQ